MKGYAGKALRVDLSEGRTWAEPLLEEELRKYVGGTGYAGKVLWEEMGGGSDPLGESAVVVLATGPVTGTLCPSGGSYEVCFKSPATGAWCQSRSGGAFGPMLKYAGFDFVIIRGVAKEPAYLWIHDGVAELKPANHLWGLTVEQTTDALVSELGDPGVSVACIGPAGENKVLFAAVMNERGRAAGRGGAGAVLGSKKLKAVVVNGTGGIGVADPEGFASAVTEAENALKGYPFPGLPQLGTISLVSFFNSLGMLPTRNFRTSFFPEADRISGEVINRRFVIKRRACYGCSFGCGRYSAVRAGRWVTPPGEGPEYETVDMLGANCGISDPEVIIHLNYLCNDYGLDTISTGSVIAFAMECFEEGIISAAQAEGRQLRWGDGEAAVWLVEQITGRRGIGDVLANGVKAAAAQLGGEADRFAMHVKGLEVPGHEPRAESKLLAIQYATSPRGACHMHPNWASTWDFELDCGMKELGLPWPPEEPQTESFRKGQGYYYVAIQGEVSEVVGACVFHSWGTEGSCITPSLYARMIQALTGWPMETVDLVRAAERSWNLKRCFNVREGFGRKDDTLPPRLFEAILDGPAAGARVQALDEMLDGFYEACGWDRATGVPKAETLERLGLGFVREALKL